MKQKIWRNDVDEYKLKPLTDDMIRKAEEELGVKLPESYLAILKEQNGGHIEFDSYPTDTPNSWEDDHVTVDHILGIGKENGILESHYLIKEWNLPENVVLISGDGPSWVALDYRNTKQDPPVTFIDTNDDRVIELAANFEIFLSELTTLREDVDFFDITPEEAEKIFNGNDSFLIEEVVLSLQHTNTTRWYFHHLLKLAVHKDLIVRQAVVSVLRDSWEQYMEEVDDESKVILKRIVEILAKDQDTDIVSEADELR